MTPSPSGFSLPTGAKAGWDLCFDQAVVFIEDAIQVGSAAAGGWARVYLQGCEDWVMVPW